MRLIFSLILAFSFTTNVFGQFNFANAYQVTSHVPDGILESVAWKNTHLNHFIDVQEGCTGMPVPFGIMGLFDYGKGYFKPNGHLVAKLSGIDVQSQKLSPENQILAYAKAFDILMQEEVGINGNYMEPKAIREVLSMLSEIPNEGEVNMLAKDLQVCEILELMNDKKHALKFGFKNYSFDLKSVFGADNYEILSSDKISCSTSGITAGNKTYAVQQSKSIEYGPAIWNPAATCNFSSRNGIAISAITIHTIQGSYAGAISWAQNCNSSVSYHYVLRSSDGQVTQMVSEADKAWHVGTENPYTIGYEHEGYVTDSTWYTDAMIQSSAALSRDVVQSGYGIPPLRTYYGASSSGVNVIGGCTKIKGHQHYPNQTHTDPGIYWDWEEYYQLINNNPIFTTVSTTSGNLYDTGGPSGNYQDDEREFWLIQPANAASITLTFSSFDLEQGYDNLFIYDGDSTDAPLIGVYTGTNSPGIVSSTGGSLLLEFRSDCGTVAPGWQASYSTTLFDLVAPNTVIQTTSPWQTDDFVVSINDTDNASGIAESFYLLAEKQTTDNDWHTIGGSKHVYESFEDNSTNWLSVTGTYSINNGSFEFSDTLEQNSNVYMSVPQDSTFTYLYEWDQLITSSASNQRAGMHFFVDNPNLANRGNSYFVYLRESNDKVQIYSVTNDIYNLEVDAPLTVNAGQWYNCKVIYNPVTGEILVYVDNSLITSWQDLSPLQNGGFISLRTGGCEASFDNIQVYTSRGSTVNITAGFGDLMSIESLGASATGFIRSIVIDGANNWSSYDDEPVLLDFTKPIVNYLYDGPSNDIDTFMTSTIEANWSIEDPHSGIADFEVAIGTLPAFDDVYPWTNNGINSAFSYVLSSPIYNQLYYISVRANNGAGLQDQFLSNGQRYIDNVGVDEISLDGIIIYPNPVESTVHFKGFNGKVPFHIYDSKGRLCMSGEASSDTEINLSQLRAGAYKVVLRKADAFVIKQLIKQ